MNSSLAPSHRLGIDVVTTLLLVSLLGCGTRRHVPQDLVPDDAIVTVAVDWNEVRRDSRIAAIAGTIRPTLDRWGVEEAKVGVVTMFARLPEGMAQSPALILQGSGLGRSVPDGFRSTGREERRGPYTLFRDSGRDEGILVLALDTVVVGPLSDLDAVLAKVADRRSSRRREAELLGLQPSRDASAVTITMVWPTEFTMAVEDAVALSSAATSLFGWEPLGSIVGRLGIGRAFVATVSPAERGLALHLGARFSDEATSRSIAAGLSAARSLSRFAGIQTSMLDLRDLDVSRVGPTLSIRTFIPNESLSNLVR